MPTISINIPTAEHGQRIMNAFAVKYNYKNIIPDGSGGGIPNPQSKAEFAKRRIVEYIRSVVKEHEAKRGIEAARQTVNADVEALDIA